MYKPKVTNLSATSTQQSHDCGTVLVTLIIKNEGDAICYFDFDEDVSTTTSFPLEPGEVLTIEDLHIRRLNYKTSAGTTTVRLVRLHQR